MLNHNCSTLSTIDFLKKRSILSIALVIMAIIGLLTYVLYYGQNQQFYGEYLNITGKQRMLSQKIVLHATLVMNDKDSKHNLLESIKQMRDEHGKIHAIITHHSSLQTLKHQAIDIILNEFWTHAINVADTQDTFSYHWLLANNEVILHQLDGIVEYAQSSYDAKMAQIYMLGWLGLVIFCLSVIFIYIVIIKRANHQVFSALNELHAYKETLKDILHNTPYAMYAKDLAGHSLIANDVFLKTFTNGHSLHETQLDYETQKTLTQFDKEVISTRQTIEATIVIHHHMQSIHYELMQFPILSQNGELYGLCTILHDISKEMALQNEANRLKEGLEKAQNIMKMGSWRLDAHLGFMEYSKELFRILGYEHHVEGADFNFFLKHLHPSDIERFNHEVDSALVEGKVFSGDYRIILPSLEKRIIHQKGEVIFDELLRPIAMVASVWDVTEQRRLEKLVFDNQKLIDEYVITSSTDIQGNITAVSEAFCRISGYSKSELLGKSHNIVRHPEMSSEVYEEMWETIRGGSIWSGEIKNLTKQGHSYWVHAIITPLFSDDEIVGFSAVRQDITDKKRVEHMAISDELTKLYNRRRFNEVFSRVCKEKIPFVFIIMDIDNFKKYNDNYGHQKGDSVLESVAHVLQKTVKAYHAEAYRLGGEEFGVILEGRSAKYGLKISQEICDNVRLLNIEHSYNVIDVVTISIGVFDNSQAQMSDSKAVYRMADKALYEAKEGGRNCVRIIKA